MAVLAWSKGLGTSDDWGYWSAFNIIKAGIGLVRFFVGAHFVFSFPSVLQWKERTFPNNPTKEEIFLVRDLSHAQQLVLSALAATFIIAVLFLLTAGVLHLVRSSRPQRQSEARAKNAGLAFGTLFIMIHGIFVVWWAPMEIEFWVILAPYLVIALGSLMQSIIRRRYVSYMLGIAVGALFLSNLLGSIVPLSDRHNDYWYQFNSWLLANCREGDLIITGSGYVSDSYLAYYCESKVYSPYLKLVEFSPLVEQGVRSEQDIYRQIAAVMADGHVDRVLVSSTVAHPFKELLFDPTEIPVAQRFFAGIRPELTLIHSDAYQDIFLYTGDRLTSLP